MNTSVLQGLLPVLALLCASAAYGQTPERYLPFPLVQNVCAKYKNSPLFVKNGEVTTADCPYIERLAKIDGQTPLEIFRQVLVSAKTAQGLKSSRGLPDGLSCAGADEQRVREERLIKCPGFLGGEAITYEFFANERGDLTRVEVTVDYKKIYSKALDRAIARGSISKFFDAYVDLQSDLLAQKLLYTARDHDKVVLRDGVIQILVTAPHSKAWWQIW